MPPELLREWLKHPKHRQFLLRVAVSEVEAWLLGDHEGLERFLGLRKVAALASPESVSDPKMELLKLASKARSRSLRDALVWQDRHSGRLFQGPDYNGSLGAFVLRHWDLARARRRCPSLERLFAALRRLEKDYAAA